MADIEDSAYHIPSSNTFDSILSAPLSPNEEQQSLEVPEDLNNPSSSDDYARLSCYGIKLMLDNDFLQADKLFSKYKEESIHMAVGYCYLTFLVRTENLLFTIANPNSN